MQTGIPWTQLPGLDELDWGIHEGRTATHHTKLEFHHLTKRWMNGDLESKFEGGENPLEVNARQLLALDHILKDPVSTALICMHGRALRLLLCHLTQQPLSMMDTFPHSNVALYRLKCTEKSNFEIIDFNNTDHLYV